MPASLRAFALIATIGAGLVLTACGHMPLSTMVQLRNFDAATADPDVLRVAVQIPETLEPRPKGVKLNIALWRAGGEAARREHHFVLAETADAAELARLASYRRPGTRIHVYRVDAADVVRIRAIQAEAAEARRVGRAKLHGSFGVSADACRRGVLADGAVMMTTYLKTETRGEYLTLLRDVDLRGLVSESKPFDAIVPECG